MPLGIVHARPLVAYDRRTGGHRALATAPKARLTFHPAVFIADGARPMMIDEIRRGGDDLILAIKAEVDRRTERGQFVLAGSTRFLSTPSLSESLAGRAGILEV
ncbi:AAA family ATPase [Streptosporangium sp. NBC_01756]|uniref:AAA family ATPase n=1 Tax=Streptosporangium sp. NBC_01756 TaxID=2975950 RepID=UPI002DD97503|nr:AAA family ATPase [Streptosporangium sp. NBC_01756]WSC90026.1 hypothetical protein OIE48_18140 [Streptosporangium sp. NBC_01756]